MGAANPIRDALDPAAKAQYLRVAALTDAQLFRLLLTLRPTLLGAVTVDLLNRINGYRETIDRLTARAPSNGVETSDAAARNIGSNLTPARLSALGAMAVENYRGVLPTCEDLEALTGIRHQVMSARLNDCYRLGWAERPGTKHQNRSSQNMAFEWQVTAEGYRKLREHGFDWTNP